MENKLEITEVFAGHSIRIVGTPEAPLFIAKDVCSALALENVSRALTRLEDDEKGVTQSNTLGGVQNLLFITESGLFTLILRSDKPEAKKFRKWVTSEVLPSIRKTGSYSSAPAMVLPKTFSEALRLLADSTDKNELQAAQIESQGEELAIAAPKVQFHDAVAASDDSHCISDVAKILKITPKELFDTLAKMKWVFYRSNSWVAYQDRLNAGLMVEAAYPYVKRDGSSGTRTQARITANGMIRLAGLMDAPELF